jgi:Ca2+-binding RTX toxin-like protein
MLSGVLPTVLVKRDVTLYVEGGSAIYNSAAATEPVVVVEGDVVADQYCAVYFDDSFFPVFLPTVSVTSTGSLISMASSAVQFVADDVLLNNDGFISGGVAGILLAGDQAVIHNRGVVAGLSNVGIDISGDGNTIFNSGDIHSTKSAINASGADLKITNSGTLYNADAAFAAIYVTQGDFEIRNTGSILSSSVALNLATGASGLLENAGKIEGDVYFGGDADTLLMRDGSISGDVSLYGGQDRFTMTTGQIIGDVDAGDDNDAVDLVGGTITGAVDAGLGNDVIKVFDTRVTDGVKGGDGNDTYIINVPSAPIIESADHGTDSVFSKVSFTLDANFENLTLTGTGDIVGKGNRLANSLIGNVGDNALYGRGGNDLFIADDGADAIFGGTGSDLVSYSNSDAKVTVNLSTGRGVGGYAEDDTLIGIEKLFGSAFADRLTGSAGNERLDGGIGNDVLAGGKGKDVFVFASSSGKDTIADFEQGRDTIEISGFGADADRFSDIKPLMSQHGKDVWIDFGSTTSGDLIVIKGAAIKDFAGSDFDFV